MDYKPVDFHPTPAAVCLFPWLTVRMLIRQPVVFGILELKVGVAILALLGSEIFKVLGAFVCVAQLVLVVDSRTVLAAVRGSAGGRWSNIRGIGGKTNCYLKSKRRKMLP